MKSLFKKCCYASQHLRMAEHGLLDVCLRLTSGGKNPLYFDGRNMAARFKGAHKDAIYRATLSLVKQGWLIPSMDRGRSASRRQVCTPPLSTPSWTTRRGSRNMAPMSVSARIRTVVQSHQSERHRSQNQPPPFAKWATTVRKMAHHQSR